MAQVFEEFLNDNMLRAYPLEDNATGRDTTGAFTLPSSLITDIFLCVPDIPDLNINGFYISKIVIRSTYLDIEISYDDPLTPEPIGSFTGIDVNANTNSTYSFIRNEIQTENDLAPLYLSSGQIIIGYPRDSISYLGTWLFDPIETELISSRISLGVLAIQSITANDRTYSGNIKIREGNNVTLNIEEGFDSEGNEETVITISAALTAAAPGVSLQNDDDVINALIQKYGVPIQTINGLFPDPYRNFNFQGADCTTVAPPPYTGTGNAITLDNPCAKPCCEEDPTIDAILESIANLNLRYGQLRTFFEATSASINNLQNKLILLSENF